jgi:hypothetical protein
VLVALVLGVGLWVGAWRWLLGSLRVGRRVGPWRGGLLGSFVALVLVGCWSLSVGHRVGPWRRGGLLVGWVVALVLGVSLAWVAWVGRSWVGRPVALVIGVGWVGPWRFLGPLRCALTLVACVGPWCCLRWPLVLVGLVLGDGRPRRWSLGWCLALVGFACLALVAWVTSCRSSHWSLAWWFAWVGRCLGSSCGVGWCLALVAQVGPVYTTTNKEPQQQQPTKDSTTSIEYNLQLTSDYNVCIK